MARWRLDLQSRREGLLGVGVTQRDEAAAVDLVVDHDGLAIELMLAQVRSGLATARQLETFDLELEDLAAGRAQTEAVDHGQAGPVDRQHHPRRGAALADGGANLAECRLGWGKETVERAAGQCRDQDDQERREGQRKSA
jgi:hypothetical protein